MVWYVNCSLQAKAYARNGDKSYGRSESDRGTVRYCYHDPLLSHLQQWYLSDNCFGTGNGNPQILVRGLLSTVKISNLVIATNFAFNVLVTFAGWRYLSIVTKRFFEFKKLSSDKTNIIVSHSYMYWVIVILVGMFNLGAFVADLIHFMINYHDTIGSARVTKITLIVLNLVSEPFIAWKAAKHVNSKINITGGISCNICCFHCMKLRCCKSSHDWKLNIGRLVHTISLCHVLWFVHRLASGAVVTVFHIINNAPQTLSVIAIIFLVVFCIFVMLYSSYLIYIAYRRSTEKRDHKNLMFLKIFVNILFWIALIISLILVSFLYLVLLHYGLNYSPLSGLLLSALPPTALFIIGFYIKDHATSVQTTNTMPEESPSEEEPLINTEAENNNQISDHNSEVIN